jgi:hypothetical protein
MCTASRRLLVPESVLVESPLGGDGGVLARGGAPHDVGVHGIEDPRLGVGLDAEGERVG